MPAQHQRPFLSGRLRGSAQARSELTAAARWGVPPSIWRGRQLKSVTTYAYDQDGRLLRAETVRDPAWLATDRAEALALLVDEAQRCPGCGQHIDDSSDPELENDWTVREAWCLACSVREHVAKDHHEPGYYAWPVRRSEQPLTT